MRENPLTLVTVAENGTTHENVFYSENNNWVAGRLEQGRGAGNKVCLDTLVLVNPLTVPISALFPSKLRNTCLWSGKFHFECTNDISSKFFFFIIYLFIFVCFYFCSLKLFSVVRILS